MIYNESKIENVFNLYLQKSPSINKKELDIKTTKKVFRELSILLCFDLEPCYSLMQEKYKNKNKKSISYPAFKECLLDYINAKESKLNKNLIREHNSPFDVDFDYAPTNEDMVNNRQNILDCIHLTDDINLIMLHRSLYILQKKFEQNKEQLKNIYKKYGEYLDKEEEILIDESYIPLLLKEIFNLNKFEISYVDNFKEAIYKEMDYCKEITIEEYIFNEFIEFIRNNRKRYNFIFREKRNNTVFNLENYEQYEVNENDDLTKEAKVSMFDEEEEDENIILNNNNKKIKIASAKYRNKLVLEEIKIRSQNEIFKNLNMKLKIMKDKDSLYSESENEKYIGDKYSESSIATSHKKGLSVKGLNFDGKIKKITNSNYDSESGEGTHRSNFPKKIKAEIQENIILENEDDNDNEEKESNNNKAEEKEKENEKEDNIEENNNDNIKENNGNNNENNENNNENNENDDIVNQDSNSMNENEKIDKKKQLLFSSKKKKVKDEIEKDFYETKYKEPTNIKSVKFYKHYLYVDILPLIIADFISDERNLYLILDHSDDLRNNLSSTFDVEILHRLGKYSLEEISNKRNDKISELTKNKLKLEKNIEKYEKLSQEMKEKNQNITYILITLQKLKDFLNWLNTKLHVLQNDIRIFKDYEKNKNEKEEEISNKLDQKIEKKNKIVENYKQIKRDFEIRKFIVAQRKMVNSNKKKKLKPIIKKNNSNINNSNNSNNNISNIDENSNSNNHSFNSNEMTEDYNDSFMLVENNASNKKKPKFYYPKVKKLNLKSNYDDIMTEKKVNDDEEDISKSMKEMSKTRNKNDKNKKLKKEDAKKFNNSIKRVKINISQQEQEQEQEENNQDNDNNNINENVNENGNEEFNNKIDYENNNIYNNINTDANYNEESNIKIENENNEDANNKKMAEEASKKVQENKNMKNNRTKLNKNQKMNSNIKVSKKAKKILKTIHKGNSNNLNNNSNSDININVTSNILSKNINTENSANIKLRTEANERIEKKVNKKIRYILKKKEDTKKLSKDEKRELAFKEIFDHYSSKHSLLENKSSTFDAIQNKVGHLSLNEYCCFCNDFKIPLTKDKIFALYNKSISTSSKIMSFQEFKVSLISMSFSINDYQIEEINRKINIFIGKAKLKNKERSRFEKDDEKEMEKNKEIIKEKMIEIENLQNKSENQIIEEFFEFLEIDYEDKYRLKMKGIYNPINKNIKKNELSLPKIKENIPKKSNNKNMKSNSVLTYRKKEEENIKPTIKKLYIGKQIWVKDMVEKEKGDTPKRDRIVYDTDEESEEDEKDNNLPAIESSGVPLFSRNNNLENKYFDK